MNLLQYLQAKYSVEVPTTILASEARIFGFNYPLHHGWLKEFGSVEINESMRARLIQSLKNKKGKTANMAAKGLEALGYVAGDPVPVGAGPVEKRLTKAQRKAQAKAAKRARQVVQADYDRVAEQMRRRAKEQRAPKFKPSAATYMAGGFRVESDEFLGTYEWRVLRMQALKLHGARCQCCGDTPANGAIMNVDHIKPRRIFPQLALDLSNLQILCGPCNHGKGNWDMTDWRQMEDLRLDEDQADHIRSILRG